MDLLEVLRLDELSHGLANLSMFPYFDMAHYIMSVMALREQPGEFKDTTKSSPPHFARYCCNASVVVAP